MTGYWLVKSEPGAFSWEQQLAHRVEPWTGVRSHLASNNLKAMRTGDLVFFYHSNVGKQIVGIVKVVREAYPDPTAKIGDWVCVDMEAVRPLPKAVTLVEMKADRASPVCHCCSSPGFRSCLSRSLTGTEYANLVD